MKWLIHSAALRPCENVGAKPQPLRQVAEDLVVAARFARGGKHLGFVQQVVARPGQADVFLLKTAGRREDDIAVAAPSGS